MTDESTPEVRTTYRFVGDRAPLFKALAEARKEFSSLMAEETADVVMKTGGKYSFDYADLGAVINCDAMALASHGLHLLQMADVSCFPYTMTCVVTHVSGSFLEAVSTFPKTMHEETMQGCGGAITYMRRYTEQALFHIAARDDDANQADGNQATIGPRQTPPRAPQKPPAAPKPAQPAQAPKASPVKAEAPRPAPREVPEDLPPEAIAAMAEDGPVDAGEVATSQKVTQETQKAIFMLLQARDPQTGRRRYETKELGAKRVQSIVGRDTRVQVGPKEWDTDMTEAEGCKVLSVLRNEP